MKNVVVMGVVFWLAMAMMWASVIAVTGALLLAIVVLAILARLAFYAHGTFVEDPLFAIIASVLSALTMAVGLPILWTTGAASNFYGTLRNDYAGGYIDTAWDIGWALFWIFVALRLLRSDNLPANALALVLTPAAALFLSFVVMAQFCGDEWVKVGGLHGVYVKKEDLKKERELMAQPRMVEYVLRPVGGSSALKSRPSVFNLSYSGGKDASDTQADSTLYLPWSTSFTTTTGKLTKRAGYAPHLKLWPGLGFGPHGYHRIECQIMIDGEVVYQHTSRVARHEIMRCGDF